MPHSHAPTMQEAPLKYFSALRTVPSWSSTIIPKPRFFPLDQALAAGLTFSSTHLADSEITSLSANLRFTEIKVSYHQKKKEIFC